MPDNKAQPTMQPGWQASQLATGTLVRKPFEWGSLLPLLGPVLLFVIWDLVVRFGLVKAILLPPPADRDVIGSRGFQIRFVMSVHSCVSPLY